MSIKADSSQLLYQNDNILNVVFKVDVLIKLYLMVKQIKAVLQQNKQGNLPLHNSSFMPINSMNFTGIR